MMDRIQTLLHWSTEYSAEQPDVAALLARAAATLMSRSPRKVVDLPVTKVESAPVTRLPTISPDFRLTAKRAKIYEILREMPGSTMQEVCTLGGFERANVNQTFLEMEKAGLLTREAGVPNGTTKPAQRWFIRGQKGKEGVA